MRSSSEAVSPQQTPLETYLDTLPGGVLIWIFFGVEMLTFGLFFLGYAWMSQQEPLVFQSSQQALHPRAGTLNTIILLTGSWAAARGIFAYRQGKVFQHWFYGCGLSGLLFLGIKAYEYSHLFQHGISLSTNTFWFFYIFLTLMHNLHVIFGIYFMFFIGKTYVDPQGFDAEIRAKIEATAIYWHLVDILWLFLFPLLYFAH